MDKELVQRVFACIDNTTLNATDNDTSVEAFCRHTMGMTLPCPSWNGKVEQLQVAAVCVYPRFVHTAKRVLHGSGIKVASVAGAFPHGQLPVELKVAEVAYVIEQGADEVDIVINRGALLAGDDKRVMDEVAMMKEACGGKPLKVILETGELPSPSMVEKAARLAIEGGADFIKTSTGKIATGATLEAAEVMLKTIAESVKINKKIIGFKAAGGISTPEEALAYADLARKILGDDYINSQTFRIGASRLTNRMHALLT